MFLYQKMNSAIRTNLLKTNEQGFRKYLVLTTFALDKDVKTIITKKLMVISVVELLKNKNSYNNIRYL
jgi:hypothetical protein